MEKDIIKKLNEYKNTLEDIGSKLNISEKENRLKELDAITNRPDFWTNVKNTKDILNESKSLRKIIDEYSSIKENIDTLIEMTSIDINYVDTNIIEYLYYILQKQLLDFYYFTRKIDFTSSRCGLSASFWNTATWFRSAPPSVYAGKRKPHSGSPGSYSSARGQITQIRYSKTASDSHSRSLSAAFAGISYLSWKI